MGTIKYMIFIIFFLLVCVSGYGAYLLFYPFDPIRDQAVTIKYGDVSLGGRQCFTITGNKLIAAPTDVFVDLLNGESIPIMSFPSNEPPGPFTIMRCFNIPLQVEPSKEDGHKYKIRVSAKYHVNPVRDVHEKAISDCFNINNNVGVAIKEAIIKQDSNIFQNSQDIKKLKGK